MKLQCRDQTTLEPQTILQPKSNSLSKTECIMFFMIRRLGYIVDLEDRRGKDEQRVDESLQLWIYKVTFLRISNSTTKCTNNK